MFAIVLHTGRARFAVSETDIQPASQSIRQASKQIDIRIGSQK